MNLFILIPVLLAIVALVLIFGRRGNVGRHGLGNRPDSEERPELTGTEQHKHREP